MARKLKNTPVPTITQIRKSADLYAVAYNSALQVVDRLPAILTFSINPRSSWVLKDGTRKSGYFATLEISIISKRGTKTVIDEIMLGQIGAALNSPIGLNAGNVASQIQTALQEAVQTYLPVVSTEAPGVAVPPPAATPAPVVVPVAPQPTQPTPQPTQVPTAPAKPSAASFFTNGEAYKYSNNATVYIFFSNQLHGVVGPNAYARYYGKAWDGKTDLNLIHPINTMPNLTSADVPNDFFNGALIQ